MIATSRRSLRRLRAARQVARVILLALAVAGIAASARMLLAPPRPVVRATPAPQGDRAAEAVAAAFARAYLTLDGARPDGSRARLAALTGDQAAAALDADAPPLVRQRVRWVDAVAVALEPGRRRVVTVAADTDRLGLVHLAVTVARGADGSLRVEGPPALVGGAVVAAADADPDARAQEVDDPGMREVARRALENYLAGAARNLAADLTAAARVTLPDPPMRLVRMVALRWSVPGRVVAAAVEATDTDGVRYALRYELGVARAEDRWEIAAIGTDPTA